MSKRTYLVIIVLIVLVGAAVAAFYTLQSSPNGVNESKIEVGVKVGDVFTYQMTGYAESHTDEVTIPVNFLDVNRTDYYRVEITNVDTPLVSYVETCRFKNGTEYSYVGTINLENGALTNNGGFWCIYAANLTKGDLSRPGVSDGAIIDDTTTTSYHDGDRQTNFLRAEGEFYDVTDLTYSKIYYGYTYVNFDQKLGMLVELRDMKIYNDPEIILTVEWKLISSNVLQVP